MVAHSLTLLPFGCACSSHGAVLSLDTSALSLTTTYGDWAEALFPNPRSPLAARVPAVAMREAVLCPKFSVAHSAKSTPLAGPVVAGAVILDPAKEILYLNDSKKLSPARRDLLYDEIGSGLLVKEVKKRRQELFESLEMFYGSFILGGDNVTGT